MLLSPCWGQVVAILWQCDLDKVYVMLSAVSVFLFHMPCLFAGEFLYCMSFTSDGFMTATCHIAGGDVVRGGQCCGRPSDVVESTHMHGMNNVCTRSYKCVYITWHVCSVLCRHNGKWSKCLYMYVCTWDHRHTYHVNAFTVVCTSRRWRMVTCTLWISTSYTHFLGWRDSESSASALHFWILTWGKTSGWSRPWHIQSWGRTSWSSRPWLI